MHFFPKLCGLLHCYGIVWHGRFYCMQLFGMVSLFPGTHLVAHGGPVKSASSGIKRGIKLVYRYVMSVGLFMLKII